MANPSFPPHGEREGLGRADPWTHRDRDRDRDHRAARPAWPPAHRCLDDRAVGIGGALVGGIVASAIGEGDIFELNFIGTIVGIIAAVGLIAIAAALGVGDDRARRV